MKRTYHLCLSAGNENMFRDEADYIHGVNCLCLAAIKTDSIILAYSFMSNHVHICVRTADPDRFMKAFRYPYNRYFNKKYMRKGRIGEHDYFLLKIDGLYHLLTAIAYVLRNPLHHGVAATPFGYRFSSVNAIFRKELGRDDVPQILPEKSCYLYLPSRATLPKGYFMGPDGMILPETFVDVADLQHKFATARTYLYYMNRLSGEAWEKEQLQDNTNQVPIGLDNIEQGVCGLDMRSMFANEHGRANYMAMTDMEICTEIDSGLRLSGETVYTLTPDRLIEMAGVLKLRYPSLSRLQLTRCLGGFLLDPDISASAR